MRRRFQAGHVFPRGKRRKVWVGRYLEPILESGELRTVLRSKVIRLCTEMSKREARTILEGWLTPINEGTHTPVESATFREFYDKWEGDLLPTYRESTREFYRSTAKRWIQSHFAAWRIREIRPADVQQFINLFSGKYSRSVLKHVRATLNCLFETAVRWQYIRENPAGNLRLPPRKAVQRAVVLKPEQISQLIGHLEEPCKTMVMLAATTGLRESELFGLQWGDINLANGTLSVHLRVYKRKVGETKTPQSAREIPLCPQVTRALRNFYGAPEEFIFHGRRGAPHRADEVMAWHIAPVARALGLPDFTWRSFRRSAKSAMHGAGLPLKVQQSMLGHVNPNTTLLYAEADESGKRAEVDYLGELIFPNFSQIPNFVGTTRAN